MPLSKEQIVGLLVDIESSSYEGYYGDILWDEYLKSEHPVNKDGKVGSQEMERTYFDMNNQKIFLI